MLDSLKVVKIHLLWTQFSIKFIQENPDFIAFESASGRTLFSDYINTLTRPRTLRHSWYVKNWGTVLAGVCYVKE